MQSPNEGTVIWENQLWNQGIGATRKTETISGNESPGNLCRIASQNGQVLPGEKM